MAPSQGPTTEGARGEELPKAGAEPTMVNVRSNGLKLDLVLLKNRVSGLTIDYQGISESNEPRKWLKIVDGLISFSGPSPERLISQILVEVAKSPASQPERLKGPEEELQKEAEPTMLKVRSEGLKLDLVLLKNKVSGLTIDYQDISESSELQKWVRIIEGIIPEFALSPESVPEILDETAKTSTSQPKLPKEEQEQSREENDYRKIVLHAVDVALDMLGHDQKHSVLSFLENEYDFREKDIPDSPEHFVGLLYEILGTSAQDLEREIIENIRIVWMAPGETLGAVVKSLKEHYQAKAPAEAAPEDHGSFVADAGE